MTPGSDAGAFSRTTWNISINPGKFSQRAGVTEVGQLTLDEGRNVADTIFHESRHSEQYFRIARVQAGRVGAKVTADKAAKRVADDMSIPLDVAKAAVKVPLKAGVDDADLITEASDWESITVGRRRSAVARSPCAHRFANPFPGPLRRSRAGMAAFAIRVGVALAVPWRGGRPAAATHSAVARLDRACPMPVGS